MGKRYILQEVTDEPTSSGSGCGWLIFFVVIGLLVAALSQGK